MFDGLPQDHLHQFIASRPSSNNNNINNINSLPLHSSNFMISSNSSFDSYPHLIFPLQHQHQQHDHQIFLHHQHPILHQNKTLITSHNNGLEKDIIAVDDVRRERVEEEDHLHHHHHRQAVLTVVNLEIERDRQRSSASISMAHTNYDHPNAVVDGGGGGGDHPWTTDEILSLLRIRSAMENWFPDFTWEHVSRKLAELGFKMRSGEKCKERFEEESRYLNNINNNHSNNICTNKANVFMPFLSDLDEELYSHNNTSIIGPQKAPSPSCELLLDKRVLVENNNNNNNSNTHIVTDEVFGATKEKVVVEEERQETNPTTTTTTNNNNKRKRKRSCFSSNNDNNSKTKFEMFKGFCEEIVNKVMSHQEEMHHKLLEDMVKRDQEKLRKEEAWKKSEVDRMNKELDFMAQQQAIAGDRQATIIEFLRKFTSTDNNVNNNISTSANFDDDLGHDQKAKSTRSVTLSSSSTSLLPISPNCDQTTTIITSSNNVEQNPTHVTDQNPSSDLGKRWPRDEVLALINLRSSLYNSSSGSSSAENHHQGEGSNIHKAVPLWERISQGMGEKGFKRSAKRCKEKWENINKYFRKTKDTNKKRSVDSRTCPYFHQLSSLYGTSTLGEQQTHHHHHHYRDQDRSSDQGDHRDFEDSSNSRHVHNVVAPQGERSETTIIAPSNVVPPAFDFEF